VHKERLELSETERQALQELIRRGENKACVSTCARILPLSAVAVVPGECMDLPGTSKVPGIFYYLRQQKPSRFVHFDFATKINSPGYFDPNRLLS
jgi:hypothetical protein